MVNLSRLYVRFSENGQQSIVSSGATKLPVSKNNSRCVQRSRIVFKSFVSLSLPRGRGWGDQGPPLFEKKKVN